MRWKVSDSKVVVLKYSASGICSKQHKTSLCSSYLASSQIDSVPPYDITDTANTSKDFRLILRERSTFHTVDNQSVDVHH